MTDYAELHAHSAYSFLDGANQPRELVKEAVRLGLTGLGLTDHNGLYGVVQLHEAARKPELPTVIGAEITLGGAPRTGGKTVTREEAYDPAGAHLVILARGPEGYHRLSRALSLAHMATGKKDALDMHLEELGEHAGGEWLVLTGCRKGTVQRALADGGERAARRALTELVDIFGRDNVAVEVTARGMPEDSAIHAALAGLAGEFSLPLVATGGVHCARPSDQRLADVLAATRARAEVEEIEGWLPPYPAHLRSAEQMLRLHRAHPYAVDNAAKIAAECSFDLELIAPNLPDFPVPEGHTEATWLVELTERGAVERYGPREAERTDGAWAMIERELKIIQELGFPGYFLIVHEIVEFCRDKGILCQGRGSAANSAVCYALGITAVDAVKHKLLFERFLSPGRVGYPDIDIDIESGRREEVIQHVYHRYGRHHSAMVANVISYRPRSAVRDTARALGYGPGQAEAWSKHMERWGEVPDDIGVPDRVVQTANELLRLPRHLGIHPGGMVICDRPVIDVCPVEWATMPRRTVLQWDKDDCADAGLAKFDLLGLGMLTALSRAFRELEARGVTHEGKPISIQNLPQEDRGVYDLLCAAETVGVFQVESRAQMATLPRLRPKEFYDIVIEVALIRPGPIQGNSVNPYIRRKAGEKWEHLHPLLAPALDRTEGVPLFQEQLMQIAVDVAGFNPAEADQLRKAMGSKRSDERMQEIKGRLMDGMAEKGVSEEIGEKIFAKLKAFADFGFPESHAFSFAYLVYVSAWLKVYHPEIFYASLLASQPMGFYSPQSLVADARRHGVRILPADITVSDVHPCVEYDDPTALDPDAAEAVKEAETRCVLARADRAVRLGLAAIKGIGEAKAEQIVAERQRAQFDSLADLSARVRLSRAQLEALSAADALRVWGSRRENLWSAGALAGEYGTVRGKWVQPPLPGTAVGIDAPELPRMEEVEEAVADVWATGISPSAHPIEFVRDQLDGVLTTAQARAAESGLRVRVAGIVTHRQRPGTAKGVTFLSLEDETGLINVVCSAGMWARYRRLGRTSAALIIRGIVESDKRVMNLVADHMEELSLRIPSRSRDFR